MITENTAPGVIVQEPYSLALSVNESATAIPVFIGPSSTSVEVKPVDSWLEYNKTFPKNTNCSVSKLSKSKTEVIVFDEGRSLEKKAFGSVEDRETYNNPSALINNNVYNIVIGLDSASLSISNKGGVDIIAKELNDNIGGKIDAYFESENKCKITVPAIGENKISFLLNDSYFEITATDFSDDDNLIEDNIKERLNAIGFSDVTVESSEKTITLINNGEDFVFSSYTYTKSSASSGGSTAYAVELGDEQANSGENKNGNQDEGGTVPPTPETKPPADSSVEKLLINKTELTADNKYVRISGYIYYYCEENKSITIAKGVSSTSDEDEISDRSYFFDEYDNKDNSKVSVVELNEQVNEFDISVRHYFDNGGGRCYILSFPEEHFTIDESETEKQSNERELNATNTTNKIMEAIQKYDDISLIVCSEQKIYSKLLSLCKNNAGYFCLFNMEANTKLSDDNAMYGAGYYPKLKTEYPLMFMFREEEYENIKVNTSFATGKKFKELSDNQKTKIKAGIEQLSKKSYVYEKDIPPTAAVAGAYCRSDRERGVWKAPANIPLTSVKALTNYVTDDQQGGWNENGINVIRQFTGKGNLIWGARTLDTNASDKSWRYIPVRRLFSAAERDIKAAMSFAVFEPNSQPTWERVRSAIVVYLRNIWRQGGLMGSSEKEAFYVHIGLGITMTPENVNDGQMIVEVGMAAVKPAEFIILKFLQKVSGAA